MREYSKRDTTDCASATNQNTSNDRTKVVLGTRSHEMAQNSRGPFNDANTENAWLEILGLNA